MTYKMMSSSFEYVGEFGQVLRSGWQAVPKPSFPSVCILVESRKLTQLAVFDLTVVSVSDIDLFLLRYLPSLVTAQLTMSETDTTVRSKTASRVSPLRCPHWEKRLGDLPPAGAQCARPNSSTYSNVPRYPYRARSFGDKSVPL